MNIEDFLKQNKTYNPLAKGSTKKATEMLLPNEKLIYAINANVSIIPISGQLKINTFKIKNKINGIVALTNNRLFFCSSILGNQQTKQILVKDITSFDDSSNFLGLGTLRVCGITEMFVIDLPKKVLNEFKEKINYAISLLDTCDTKETTLYSKTDEIKKYKELLDCGAITQEEFEKEKQKILN